MNKKINADLANIGDRLKAVRTALGLSIDKIGGMTGFSRSLISEVENGYKKPSSIYLYGLLDLFRVNINYILIGEGEMFLNGANVEAETETDDDMKEMLYYMENVSLVKYSVLSFFIDFKTRSKDVIGELLDKALEKKKKENKLKDPA